MDNQHEPTLFGLKFDDSTRAEIKSIATWSAFISYTVFGFLFLIFLILILSGSQIARQFGALSDADATSATMAGTFIVLIFGFFMAVLGVWFYFLFKSSRLFKKAVSTGDVFSFGEGVKAMNVFFIFGIVLMVLSVLGSISSLF